LGLESDDCIQPVVLGDPTPQCSRKHPLAGIRRHDERKPSVIAQYLEPTQQEVHVQPRTSVQRSPDESGRQALGQRFDVRGQTVVSDIGRIGDDGLI
jgi:hypothetical protein